MDGAESLGISKVGQTMLARLMESQIRCHLFVALWWGGLSKETMATAWSLEFCLGGSCSLSTHPDARLFSFSAYATGALAATALVLEPGESESV